MHAHGMQEDRESSKTHLQAPIRKEPVRGIPRVFKVGWSGRPAAYVKKTILALIDHAGSTHHKFRASLLIKRL